MANVDPSVQAAYEVCFDDFCTKIHFIVSFFSILLCLLIIIILVYGVVVKFIVIWQTFSSFVFFSYNGSIFIRFTSFY